LTIVTANQDIPAGLLERECDAGSFLDWQSIMFIPEGATDNKEKCREVFIHVQEADYPRHSKYVLLKLVCSCVTVPKHVGCCFCSSILPPTVPPSSPIT